MEQVRPTVMLLYPMASTMWEVLLPFLVALWCHVVISDPGIIPRRPKGQSAVEVNMFTTPTPPRRNLGGCLSACCVYVCVDAGCDA